LPATKSGKPSKPKPPPNSPNDEQSGDGIGLDEMLRRMLATPPPAKKVAGKKKPA
jgi:hypothetical protein